MCYHSTSTPTLICRRLSRSAARHSLYSRQNRHSTRDAAIRRLDSRRCFQRCKSVEVATEVEELIQPRRPLTPAVEPRGQENLGQASQPREGDQSRKKKSARKGKRKRKSGYVDKEGLFQGAKAIDEAFSTIRWRMTGLPKKQRYPTLDTDCQAFGDCLIEWLARHPTWAGSTHSTALHRLARMRIYHGQFVHPCKQAYERLLQGIADASHRQLPRDIATALWSIAKISELDWLEAWEDLYVVEGVDALKSRMLQAAEPRKTTIKVERLQSTMDVEEVDRLDGLDSDSSGVAHQPADSIMREVSDKHPEEISELVRPLRPPDNAPHVQLEAKPRRLERRPSKTEYYSHHGTLPAKPVKWERLGDRSPGSASPELPGKEVIWVPMSFRRDLDVVARQWDSREEELYNPQSVSLVLFSFATLEYSPDSGRTLQSIQRRLLKMASQLTTIDVCIAFWSHAKLKVELPISLQMELLKRMNLLIAEKELQIISIPIIMQACVKLKLQMTHQIFTALLEYLFEGFSNRQPLNKLTPQPLAALLTAAAAAKHPLKNPWVREWGKQCYFRLKEFSTSDLVAIMVACQKLGIRPLGGQLLTSAVKLHPELRVLKLKPATPLPEPRQLPLSGLSQIRR